MYFVRTVMVWLDWSRLVVPCDVVVGCWCRHTLAQLLLEWISSSIAMGLVVGTGRNWLFCLLLRERCHPMHNLVETLLYGCKL